MDKPNVQRLAGLLDEWADSLVLNADAWQAAGLTPHEIVQRHHRIRGIAKTLRGGSDVR